MSNAIEELIGNNNYHLEPERAGKIWLIPEDAVKPADKRVSSGKYIGWREKFKKTENEKKVM